jgi:hypothetical protein
VPIGLLAAAVDVGLGSRSSATGRVERRSPRCPAPALPASRSALAAACGSGLEHLGRRPPAARSAHRRLRLLCSLAPRHVAACRAQPTIALVQRRPVPTRPRTLGSAPAVAASLLHPDAPHGLMMEPRSLTRRVPRNGGRPGENAMAVDTSPSWSVGRPVVEVPRAGPQLAKRPRRTDPAQNGCRLMPTAAIVGFHRKRRSLRREDSISGLWRLSRIPRFQGFGSMYSGGGIRTRDFGLRARSGRAR